ncbi:MAG: hypothetical protein SFW67_08660 [Myxococcaceae bacterium]|nr:hypothetical protein [Myxococcaceae bacterium]
MPTRRFFEWGAWCSSPGARYGYGEHDGGWLQSFPYADAEFGLAVVLRGAGGGSQQATFRNTLEAYVDGAVSRWKRGLPGSVVDRLRDLRLELDRQFKEATEPFFANHFQAYWAALLTDGERWAHTNMGCQRVYGFSAKGLRRLSTDDTLETGALVLEKGSFRGTPGDLEGFAVHDSPLGELAGPLPEVLVLVSGLLGKPHLDDAALERIVQRAVTGDVGAETIARLVFEQVAANGPDEQHQWFRHGAVGVVRPST